MEQRLAPRVQRKRGRPYRPPIDPSPYVDPTGGADVRMAWLLGTTRLSAAEGGFAKRRAFVPALVEHGIACDESRVSRWESGATAVSPAALTGYEKVLGLPRHALRATALMLQPELPPATPRNRVGEEDFDRLMEVILDGTPTGADWFTFADELTHRPLIYMQHDLWESLSRQLVVETGRALHVGYLTRRAALRRLLTHPGVQHHVVGALQEYVATPGAVRVADAASMAHYLPGAEATAAVMRLLGSEEAGVRRGALRAAGGLLAHRLFDERALSVLEQVVVAGLEASDTAYHLADIVRRLPSDSAHRVRSALLRHPAVELVDQCSEVVEPQLAADTARQLAALAQADAPEALREPDAMLERLVREALFHSHEERRTQAAYLLMLSPYHRLVSGACAALLCSADERVAARLVRLMRYCSTSAQLPTLLGVAASAAPDLQLAALVALGNNPHPLTERQARALVAGTRSWPTPRHVDAASYAFGMHGLAALTPDPEHRRKLSEHPDGPDRALVSAAWWQAVGPRLTA